MSYAVKKRCLRALKRSRKYNKDGSIRWDTNPSVKTKKIKRKAEQPEHVYDIVKREPSFFSKLLAFIKNLFKKLFTW